ncbi:MAG: hypothetical protein ACT4PL_01655, partial [Phycisphaerales bacterium]
LGDPLTRPFTHIPVVTVSGMPTAGSVVSGNLTFTPNATTTLPSGSIAAIDIHVDGVFRASIPRNTPFTLDTRTLADGHHEIRMIARDNSSTRSMGRLVSGFTTRNYFRSAGLNVASATGGVNTPFDFTPTASGGIVGGVRLLQNGRAIAAGNGLAPMRVYGSNLGAGSSRLRAEIHFADGRIARSEPIVVTVAPGAPVASGIPVAFSTTVVTPPGSTRLIELPAAFTGDPAGATFQTTAVPAGFTITPGTGPYRIVTAPANFSAPVTFSYTVQTSSGTSPVATISMRPSAPVPCIADFNTDGLLSPDDLDGFITAYFGDTPAERARCDFNADGFIEPGDIDEYITAFFSGC